MMKHNDFRKGGMVSVWIGNFTSDIELDEYINLSRKFEEDFQFTLNERDMPETCVECEPVGVDKLVNGFSWSESFAQAIIRLAKMHGIEKATTMVVFLNFAYQPERTRPHEHSPLKFLGAVRFS